MRALAALALLLAPVAALARPQPRPYPAPGWALPNSEVATLASADGHAYRILVAWPEGPPPASGWPVLFVLDGEDNFAIAAITARRLARAGARSGILPGVVVGVDSGPLARRVLDYTPPVPGYAIPAGWPAQGLALGGGDRFLAFLGERVLPWVDHRWPTDPVRRTLAGHSFGGLIALHALLSGNRSFTRHAAISPSLWYGDGLIAREAAALAPASDRTLLLAFGTGENGPDASGVAGAETLSRTIDGKGAKTKFLPLSGQGHGTTMLAAMGDIVALAFGKGQE